jgi:hypothetical protein
VLGRAREEAAQKARQRAREEAREWAANAAANQITQEAAAVTLTLNAVSSATVAKEFDAAKIRSFANSDGVVLHLRKQGRAGATVSARQIKHKLVSARMISFAAAARADVSFYTLARTRRHGGYERPSA